MKFTGWLSAAIEILELMETRHLPAKHALAEWGRAHRFAGSKDRTAIGNLVYDCERNRAALAYLMQEKTPRALVLAAAVHLWDEPLDQLIELCKVDQFAPAPPGEQEQKNLARDLETAIESAPLWVRANIPEWLEDPLKEQFGENLINEGRAMAERAPLDIRVNTLKTTPEKLAKALARYAPVKPPLSSVGLRVKPARKAAKAANLEAEAAHGKGWFEIQDAGSQFVARLTGAKPGDQVLDYCAGAGGKTLCLSAQMDNRGQVHAYDADKTRLRPIFERLRRAGCRNVQTHDAGNPEGLAQLKGSMDIVLIDAPCTGTGTWRRHPDARWRLTETALLTRQTEQAAILAAAADYVKPGGKLVYITCSLLRSENEDQITEFLSQHNEYSPAPYEALAAALTPAGETIKSATPDKTYLTLSPYSHGTDGFFIAVLQKAAA